MTEQNGDAGPGAGVDPAASVGEELARGRVALGLTVADIAQQLKFATRQIEALEQGRFDQLPTGTFARGMVRAYARLVRLDPEPLVQRIAGSVAAPASVATAASVRRPIPITDTSRRTNLIYAALSVALLVVIAVVVFEWQRERSGSAQLTFVPAAAQAPAPAEPQRVAAAAPATVSLPASEPSAPAASPATATAPVTASAPTPAGPREAPSAPKTDAAPASGMRRLQMKFERESWVEIRGRDGKVLTSELNPAGSERQVDGRPPFTLIIGNAHHVKLSYDERPVDLAPHVKVEVARFTLD